MKIAYCSLLLPEEKKLAERAKARLTGISLHKLISAIIQGLDANLDEPIKVFNIINTLNYPRFPELAFPTEQWSHTDGASDWHIGYINLFFIKYITQAENLYKKLYQWKIENMDEQCMICVHHIYYPAMLAACRMKKKFGDGVKICLFTGDMNGRFGLSRQKSWDPKQILIRFLEKKVDRMAKDFDCYIFATKYMAEGFGVAHKPFTVLECTYSEPAYAAENADVQQVDDGTKILFYAGAMREDYGVVHLLKAFSMIDDPNYRLWLAGGGFADSIVNEYAAKDPRIVNLGFIPPQEVDRRQRLATALLSPRTSAASFAKYSFPSKTMECLASGKPYIAHKLPCDPPEYENVIQYADDESDEALAKKIMEVCELPEQMRREIGLRAQRFIQEDKNPKAMCKRALELWNTVLNQPTKEG